MDYDKNNSGERTAIHASGAVRAAASSASPPRAVEGNTDEELLSVMMC